MFTFERFDRSAFVRAFGLQAFISGAVSAPFPHPEGHRWGLRIAGGECFVYLGAVVAIIGQGEAR